MNKIIGYANQMRQKPTAAERRFFDRVSNLDCHAQIVIGRFIADFLFPSKGIVVELDGGYHNDPEQIIKDLERDLWMKDKGLKVIRIPNSEAETYSLSKIKASPLAIKRVRDWLDRAVAFTYQIDPQKLPIKNTAPTKSQPKTQKATARIYAVFIPGEDSVVVEGRPRDVLRRVSGISGAVSKRFNTREQAQKWVDSNPKKPTIHGTSWLDSLKSPGGGWTRETLESLGIEWPPRKGWKKRLIAGKNRK